MDDKKLEQLKKDVLSLLTDKNVGFLEPFESEEEQFGALMAYTEAFNSVRKVFKIYGI